ncbi:hypothetical protein COCNU_13G004420 [Cocos nucifera]|uniref:Uncharacterized protein n=1 Tax=Cocos nucifera TaxID=13894 RepID=A0A8K0ISY4_COCNU|nr:hypothetical protein COCNU_13G004420 [Cocos nucifera]
MPAWKENISVGDEVLLLADGNGDGEFPCTLGMELDLRDKPAGLGVRSRRYAMLAEDGSSRSSTWRRVQEACPFIMLLVVEMQLVVKFDFLLFAASG